MKDLIESIEAYLADYATLAEDRYLLPLALWIVGTFCFSEFDAFPYLVITSATKRSGKTRLSELMSFACANPINATAMTGANFYRLLNTKPTIFFDEAEQASSEAAGILRSVLNAGYRKGQKVARTIGNMDVWFETYCPKAFILIGDVNNTLRDRSIIVTMKRAEAKERFRFQKVQERGDMLRKQIETAVQAKLPHIVEMFRDHEGLDFLTDRDEELWTPLVILCAVFCPERLDQLAQNAVDCATEKTADSRKYTQVLRDGEEQKATQDEYARRLLLDLAGVLREAGGVLPSRDALKRLYALPTAPWRLFKGTGLTWQMLGYMLRPYGVCAVNVRDGRGRKSHVLKSFRLNDVERALNR